MGCGREREMRREREPGGGGWTGDVTLMRRGEQSESGGGGWGAKGIWFGASRASFLACRIPGDQHHGVSFHPQPTSTTL